MKRKFNYKSFENWVLSVGGVHQATALIIQKTGLAPSTAEKMAAGRYQSIPNLLVQKALAELSKVDHEDLFPLVGARAKAS